MGLDHKGTLVILGGKFYRRDTEGFWRVQCQVRTGQPTIKFVHLWKLVN